MSGRYEESLAPRALSLMELQQAQTIKQPTVKNPGEDWIKAGKPYLPEGYDERKALPIMTGVLDYFPLAIAAIARVSIEGNKQHNKDAPLHWARGKSTDEVNTAIRHLMERGGMDKDGVPHMAKAAWRVLAALQKEEEERLGLPPSRASWVY